MKQKILSLLLALMIPLSLLGATLVRAADAPATPAATDTKEEKSDIIESCKKLMPFFAIVQDSKQDFKVELKPEEANSKTVLGKVDQASNAFHQYVGCIFDGMVDEMGKLAVNNVVESFSAYTPSLPDLRSPEDACTMLGDSNSPKFQKALNSASPKVLLPAIQMVYDRYHTYLNALVAKATAQWPVKNTSESSGVQNQLNAIQLAVDNELEASISAVETTVSAVKEMRVAYALHMEFNCWINRLEGWRNALEEIRKVIQQIPNKFQDASDSCPVK